MLSELEYKPSVKITERGVLVKDGTVILNGEVHTYFAKLDAVHTANWIYVMDDAALLEGSMAPVYPLGINVVLARVEGIIYAVSGVCAHMACPLFTGKLSGHTITCACHDWRFDIRTGKFLDAPELGIAVFAAKSEAGKLFVNIL